MLTVIEAAQHLGISNRTIQGESEQASCIIRASFTMEASSGSYLSQRSVESKAIVMLHYKWK